MHSISVTSNQNSMLASNQAFITFEEPQHFLYFLPLPHEQGSLRPTSSDLIGSFEPNNFSRSEMFSGLSGSIPNIKFHPFLLNMDDISIALAGVRTRTTAGLIFDPSLNIIDSTNFKNTS